MTSSDCKNHTDKGLDLFIARGFPRHVCFGGDIRPSLQMISLGCQLSDPSFSTTAPNHSPFFFAGSPHLVGDCWNEIHWCRQTRYVYTPSTMSSWMAKEESKEEGRVDQGGSRILHLKARTTASILFFCGFLRVYFSAGGRQLYQYVMKPFRGNIGQIGNSTLESRCKWKEQDTGTVRA